MSTNEGLIDRVLRVVVGLVLVAIALMGYSPWGWIGVVPLLTGLIGWCPAYMLFGIKTCKVKQ